MKDFDLKQLEKQVAEQVLAKLTTSPNATSDMSGGGILNTEQVKTFLDYVEDESQFRQYARFVRFTPDQMDIPKLFIGNRMLYAMTTEGQDPGFRRKVTTGKVSIKHQRVVMPIEITRDLLWFNVEGESVVDKLMRMIASGIANDMEEMAWESSVLGHARAQVDLLDGGHATDVIVDKLQSLQDGWLDLIYKGGQLVDGGYEPITNAHFHQLLRALPTKFRNRNDLVFLTNVSVVDDFMADLAKGIGNRSEMAAANGAKAGTWTAFGYPIVGLGKFPLYPRYTEHLTFTAGATGTIEAKFDNLQNAVLTTQALAQVATTPHVLDTDYSQDLATGIFTNIAAGGIADAGSVKLTYQAAPQIVLTTKSNLIFAMCKEMQLLSDVNIYTYADQYAMHGRIGQAIEEDDMSVMLHNLKLRS